MLIVNSSTKSSIFFSCWFALCCYILSYFAFGFIDGVGANIYDTSLLGIIKNVLTLGSVLVFRELVRNHIINAVEKKYVVSFGILIVLVFSFAEININALLKIGSIEELLTFLSFSVLPLLMFNTFMTVSAYIAGPLGTIIYALITNIPMWAIGVLPNLRWITVLLIGTLFPLLCIIVLRNVHKSKATRGKMRAKKEENPYSWIGVCNCNGGARMVCARNFPHFPKRHCIKQHATDD